jgi:PhzF family phenazine biosynthesis protein
MKTPIFQVDAFSEKPFTGNPAAVCLLEEEKDDNWLLDMAAEMNLSETAYLWKLENGYRLRWFTPTTEVDLCGHATLAAAHILWETGRLDSEEWVEFSTLSGILTAKQKEGWIELDFPAEIEEFAEIPSELEQALKVSPEYFGKNRIDGLVLLRSEEEILNLKPDFEVLSKIEVRGIIATAPSSSKDFDFVSRFFAPRFGINEDPVTGSAHCCLGPFWGNRLGKDELVARQLSPRGGIVRMILKGDRVVLAGKAVTVLNGQLAVP